MPKRCGDLAGFTFKVTSELVDKYATTIVSRKKKYNVSAIHTEKLKQEETKKIKWPDLEIKDKEGVFHGGRKVDYKGLNKLAYKDKLGHQEFQLSLYQGKNKKKSTGAPLKIEAYPDAGPEHKSIGIPMATEMWENQTTTNPTTGATTTVRRRIWNDATGTAYSSGSNCGNFDIELKDGVATITVKIQLTVTGGSTANLKRKIFKDIKTKSEEFWNSKAVGYLQWLYHRKECKRGKECDCKVVKNSKGKFLQSGCCKAPLNLVILAGSDNPVTIALLTSAQKTQLATLGYVTGLRADTLNFYYPENRANTFAHEVGHMMGFPDQYWYGVVAGTALDGSGMPSAGGAFPIDDSSIMGQNMGSAKKCHASASWFSDWINANVDSMEVVDN